MKQKFGAQIWAKGAKIGLKTRFLPFSQVRFSSFLGMAYNDSLKPCVTSSRGKTH